MHIQLEMKPNWQWAFKKNVLNVPCILLFIIITSLNSCILNEFSQKLFQNLHGQFKISTCKRTEIVSMSAFEKLLKQCFFK